jgi:hypothetical protein
MHADQFETRLAKLRHRFATTLESKITDAVVSADQMSRSGDGMSPSMSPNPIAFCTASAASDRRSDSTPPARLRTPPKRL